jgi:hypothetical protein
MDDKEWRSRLAEQLLGGAGGKRASATFSFSPEGATALEIAFGKARSELTYLLEFGRAHHLPVVGNVMGDEVWIRLGETTLKFTFERAEGKIVAGVAGHASATLAWDDAQRTIVGTGGAPVDVEQYVRGALDATVTAWRAASAKLAPRRESSITETVTLPDTPNAFAAASSGDEPSDDTGEADTPSDPTKE